MAGKTKFSYEEEILFFISYIWEDYLSFLKDNCQAFRAWFNDNPPELSIEGIRDVLDALGSVENGIKAEIEEDGLSRATLAIMSLGDAWLYIQDKQVFLCMDSLLCAEREYVLTALERSFDKETACSYSETVKSAKKIKKLIEKQRKKLLGPILSKGRQIGRISRQEKAKTNWGNYRQSYSGFFISGAGFRYDCTNKKITEIVFRDVGKKLGYTESTIAQRVKKNAAECRKKYAQN